MSLLFADREKFSGTPGKSDSVIRGVALVLGLFGASAWLCACSERQAPTDSALPAAASGASSPSAASTALIPSRAVSFVKLESLSEVNGKAWTTVAEFNLLDATGGTIDRKLWKATADSAGAIEQPSYAIDGDPHSIWHTAWEGAAPPPPHSLTVSLGAPTRVSGFRYLPRQDNTVNGTIARYRFYVSDDGIGWGRPVAEGDFSTQGAATLEKTVVFGVQTANHPPAVETPIAQSTPMGRPVSFRIQAVDADGDPLSYVATGLPTGLSIEANSGMISGTPIVPGSYAASVTVSDSKGLATQKSLSWVVSAPAITAAGPTPEGAVRFVRLEELTEINGGAWGSMAEFDLIDAKGQAIPHTGWSASADSAGTSEAAINAIDGNKQSLWHTQWDGAAPPPPHSFIVNLGAPTTVKGFRYTPRQDKVQNGTIAKYRFYVSQDGVNWGQPLVEGDFSTLGPATQEKTVILK